MRKSLAELAAGIESRLDTVTRVDSAVGELTYEVSPGQLVSTAQILRDEFGFEMLIDLCGVDYLEYGFDEWTTEDSTSTGFSRGVTRGQREPTAERVRDKPRFAVVVHLLSISRNERLRLRVFCEDDEHPIVDSLVSIWNCANWFEREAFDLYGVMFRGHPDLRRILTDYGFIGHPFRKDFPLIGNVEVRYDPEKKRVVYQPVTIEPRTLVPKVIRDDSRYLSDEDQTSD